MSNLNDAINRSHIIAQRIRARTDIALQRTVLELGADVEFESFADVGISERAWQHVASLGIAPALVFAHPDVLVEHPYLSEYYRGIALIPRKRMPKLAASVDTWESGTRKRPPTAAQALKVAQLYNLVVSSIIEGATSWTLENGYRSILANMAAGLDGTIRNLIGQDAEKLVQSRILDWLQANGLIVESNVERSTYTLPADYSMRFGSEPDVEFRRHGTAEAILVATIEIKGGRDPAGALERLGAVQKSFENTPPGCTNLLVAGVITPEMQTRLSQMGVVRSFLLDEVAQDGEGWTDFLNEVFHHTIRITSETIT